MTAKQEIAQLILTEYWRLLDKYPNADKLTLDKLARQYVYTSCLADTYILMQMVAA